MKRIGITQRVDKVEGCDERRDALDQKWSGLLKGLGAVAVPLANHAVLAPHYIDAFRLDGVIFSGGNDPVGAPQASGTAPERDAFEQALLELCLDRGLPVLGVCRGAQILNLFLGGRLSRIERHVAVRHEVATEASNRFGWPSRLDVNSFHSLGIREADLSPRLQPLARAGSDATVEAFQMPGLPVVGILWHPERESALAACDRELLISLFQLRAA